MPIDISTEVAKYYDACRVPFDDISFYLQQVPLPQARVLELGCGTGRVLLPLVEHCAYIHGLDCSEAMLAICQEKLQRAAIAPERARIDAADITDFDLDQQFDLITAPFRVMQNLATDGEVDGLFRGIHKHLAPSGTAILNVFRPYLDREHMLAEWCRPEKYNYEIPVAGGLLRRYDKLARITADPLVCYPELIYRFYQHEQLVDEAVLPIAMRCYYPDEFVRLIEDHGFRVTGKWGGYAGEAYGEGGELVVAFTRSEQ
ncbi:MAG TPA: class I SAM-dependent methyltransferase [Armatimonadota bacterium]|jgi:SAM-dependent methyltransferase